MQTQRSLSDNPVIIALSSCNIVKLIQSYKKKAELTKYTLRFHFLSNYFKFIDRDQI